jgi:branched-chain amino acid transport system ATP-binding protein
VAAARPPVAARAVNPIGALRQGEGDVTALLEVEHLSMRFGGLVAVGDLSFSAETAAITAIIGPNGAGKTTVFNCLTGFYRPSIGRIALHRGGRTFLLEQMDGFRIAREAGVARTFQNIRLFAGMTVLENLIVAQHAPLMRASLYSFGGLFGLPGYRRAEAEAIEKARTWLERTGLVERADDVAGSLPYGAQRRLEIARAMCTDPHLLCLDEPAAGLNPHETAELTRLLRAIRDAHGIGLLLIEHHMSVVMDISDRIVVLDYGRKIAEGSPEAVRRDPAVIKAYLGEEEEAALPAIVAADLAQKG